MKTGWRTGRSTTLIDSSLSEYSETDTNRSSPQWFVTTVGSAYALQQWPTAYRRQNPSAAFLTRRTNYTSVAGPTGDPNNVDTDGDGMIDGIGASLHRMEPISGDMDT